MGSQRVGHHWATSLDSEGLCLNLKDTQFEVRREKYRQLYIKKKKKAETSLCWEIPCSQSYSFSSSVYIYETWTIKKAEHLKIDAFKLRCLEKTLESPLDSKEIKPVNPKGNQPWIFIGRTVAEAEAPIPWPPDAKTQLIRKDPDAGKDWRQEEKGETEDEMVGWQHQLNGHEFEQAPGDSEGQESLACCSPWGRKESDMTEWMNNTNIRPAKEPRGDEGKSFLSLYCQFIVWPVLGSHKGLVFSQKRWWGPTLLILIFFRGFGLLTPLTEAYGTASS